MKDGNQLPYHRGEGMAVSSTDYGTFVVHVGTLAEVAGAMAGKPATAIIAWYYDAGATKTTAIVKKTLDAT